MPLSLHTETLRLLKNRPRMLTYAEMQRRLDDRIFSSNSDDAFDVISAAWLEQFATGRIARPPVDKVQAVYELLSGKELTLS